MVNKKIVLELSNSGIRLEHQHPSNHPASFQVST